jgi:hypothetical protein
MPDQQRSFGVPDQRSAADRLNDLRNVQRQVGSILAARDDPAFADRFIARVRERRAGRDDRTQFEVIPDRHGDDTLAAVTRRRGSQPDRPGELLIRADDLPAVERLLALYELVDPSNDQFGEPVAELDNRVVRLPAGRLRPRELAHLASSLRRQGVQISPNYVTPMGGTVKSVGSPELTAGPTPTWPNAGERASTSPIRVVIIDTGVYGVRDDGWLVGLDDEDNREDLDVLPRDGFLDLAAGHGSFCAGIVQQTVPEAHIVVSKKLDSQGVGCTGS